MRGHTEADFLVRVGGGRHDERQRSWPVARGEPIGAHVAEVPESSRGLRIGAMQRELLLWRQSQDGAKPGHGLRVARPRGAPVDRLGRQHDEAAAAQRGRSIRDEFLGRWLRQRNAGDWHFGAP